MVLILKATRLELVIKYQETSLPYQMHEQRWMPHKAMEGTLSSRTPSQALAEALAMSSSAHRFLINLDN